MKFRFPDLTSKPIAALCIPAAAFGAVMALGFAGALEVPEIRAYDRFLRAGSPNAAAAVGPVVLIEITEDDIRELGHPVCDDILGSVVSRVLAAEPRALGIDLIAKRIAARPTDPVLWLQRAALLDQVGLAPIADRARETAEASP